MSKHCRTHRWPRLHRSGFALGEVTGLAVARTQLGAPLAGEAEGPPNNFRTLLRWVWPARVELCLFPPPPLIGCMYPALFAFFITFFGWPRSLQISRQSVTAPCDGPRHRRV